MRRPLVAVALAVAVALTTAAPASAPAAPPSPRPTLALADPAPPPELPAAPAATAAPLPPPPTTTTSTTAPAPPPTTAPSQPSSSGSCGGWADVIAAHFPAEQVGTACRVMLCESRGDPTVANESGSGASGLWQFLDSTWESTTGTPAPASAYSADAQTAAAAALWRSSGWSPWSCY